MHRIRCWDETNISFLSKMESRSFKINKRIYSFCELEIKTKEENSTWKKEKYLWLLKNKQNLRKYHQKLIKWKYFCWFQRLIKRMLY